MKTWGDFKSSPTKPLFWMLLGPLLIVLTLFISLPTLNDLLLPTIAILGFLSICKWRLNAFLLTLLTFGLYACFHLFFGVHPLSLWKFGWGFSFVLALTISFFSIEELKRHYISLKKKGDQTVADLRLSLHTLEEKGASEKRRLEVEIKKLQDECDRLHQEMTALLQLVDASCVEAEKTHKQNEVLSAESLKQHRQIETLKLQRDQNVEELNDLQKEHVHLIDESRLRLKELNRLRTEYVQMQILFQTSQEDFKKFRSVILHQREQLAEKPAQSEAKPKKVYRKSRPTLKTLEKDKKAMKKLYDQIQVDCKKLSQLLERAREGEDDRVPLLEKQMIEKQEKMAETKSRLTAVEREIFVVKKEMQQEGVMVS